jgi:hypothetical protein
MNQITNPKILDLRGPLETLVLPPPFQALKEERNLRMILACGDGYGSNNRESHLTNLEAYQGKFDIFCCFYGYHEKGFQDNVAYLERHPELNIVICLFDVNNDVEMWKLVDLFQKSIEVMNTDDIRTFVPAGIAYRLLVKNGICKNISNVLADDLEYKMPFFMKKGERVYEKQGDDLYRGGGKRTKRTRKRRRQREKTTRKRRSRRNRNRNTKKVT